VSRDVAVQDLAASVLDDEKAVEQFECHRRHGEEVERHDHFPVILQERQPPLTWVTAATNSPKVPSYASFRDDEAKLLQFNRGFLGVPSQDSLLPGVGSDRELHQ
jgi:hypothetical protein